MKKLTTKLMIATAALVVAAGAASAQTMRAEVPFGFRAVDRVMEPGTYEVRVSQTGGTPVFRIRNVHSGASIALLPQAPVDPKKAWAASGEGRLVFACISGRCALDEIYSGSGSHAYTVHRPNLGTDEAAVLREIPIQPGKAE
jgi:hypothetical protein